MTSTRPHDAESIRGRSIVVWDKATRLTHWVFPVAIVLLWWSGSNGDFDVHNSAAQAVAVALIFRIYLGFFGSYSSRFDIMAMKIVGLLKRQEQDGSTARGDTIGHSALGSLSAFLMLGALSVQVGLGLFSTDFDMIDSGPLANYLDFETASSIASLHASFFNVLLSLLALHVSVILLYHFVLGKNLVRAMISGKRVMEGQHHSRTTSSLLQIIGFGVSTTIVLAIWYVF